MPQRNCTKNKDEQATQNKRIILPISQKAYEIIVAEPTSYRAWLDVMVGEYEELFPPDIAKGYWLHDCYSSKKLPGVEVRRIKLKTPDERGKDQIYTIVPSYVMPYMVGYTDDIEKAQYRKSHPVEDGGRENHKSCKASSWNAARLVERVCSRKRAKWARSRFCSVRNSS